MFEHCSSEVLHRTTASGVVTGTAICDCALVAAVCLVIGLTMMLRLERCLELSKRVAINGLATKEVIDLVSMYILDEVK